jgi:hypothetical protein
MDICSVMANIRSKPATAGHPPGVQLFVMLEVQKLCPNLSWEGNSPNLRCNNLPMNEGI